VSLKQKTIHSKQMIETLFVLYNYTAKST